jgi:CRISPR/Cas system CMR-associated protein Cmr1 (group 7 of RAMP superfamily)
VILVYANPRTTHTVSAVSKASFMQYNLALCFTIKPSFVKNCPTIKHSFYLFIFFSGEGPRCRRCGRTAVLSLLVQPCDDDDNDDDYFCPFPSNGEPAE